MASKLKAIEPKAAAPSKPKVLIYGKPGVGKTWAALDFPSVFYIDTEGGADLEHYTDKLKAAGGMYLGPEQGSLEFSTVIEQVKILATEKDHGFRTLVIDSISKLFNTAIAEKSEDLGDKDVFGASKKAGVGPMRILVRWLNKLDMNVILIAHAMAEWGINEKSRQREQIGETFDAWDRLEYELHLCLHISKEGPARFAKVRKSRLLQFPDATRFPWSYGDFADKYGRDIIEAKAKAIELATPAQVAEIKRLLGIVKVQDGWEAKFLADNDAADWAEVPAEKIAPVITKIASKLTQAQEAA
jgi:RecA/RadA recombinase